eukprot:gnl/MRDRNA2_/MRDRNA2_60266_c0_seq1.p1 gnl/MRDRNA2_/MRDRNA2_60266_c0~~gnl/MRDRNA2_/MRDRNA2_60266_c0_seq1.p1  ORF type:complete len:530 (+),score=168.91 gnl/MRDRNA2_/MRDRNA2_60266_c0_seq1:90-1679(+)
MADQEHTYDDATVTLQIQQLLDEWHYRILSSGLAASAWDRQSATKAALQLFEMQGVPFEEGAIDALAKMEEAEMLPEILKRMPDSFKSQFEHFALQLQLIVTSTTRVRNVVEAGNADEIVQVMNHTDSSGIVSQILKHTIVQAGIEVAEIRNRHVSWTKNTETRMGRLLRSADDAADAQKELKKLQAQLDDFGGAANDKSKKVMMGVAAGNDKALKSVIFGTWFQFQQKMKSEKDIRDMFEAEIENLDAKFMEYRQAQLNNVRNVLMRKAAEGDGMLMQQVWKAWADEVQETKREAGSQGAMAAMEAKLASASAAQTENTKKVMARMSAGSDNAILQLTVTAWKQFLEDYKKNKDQEDAIKAQEKAMEEFMKQKKDGAKQVLDKMNSATDSGLVEHVMSTWAQKFKDDKEARRMEAIMAENEAKFGALNGRQKDNAKGVMGRVNEQMELNCLLKHFLSWACDTKLERIMRHYNSKMEGKKQQLQSVQHLFRNFATQLDQGLKGEGDSARDSSSRRKSKDDFQLPDIQKK